ncbi:MAG: hypothetical protein R3E18_04425 [Sphingomonadaceae bacterium]
MIELLAKLWPIYVIAGLFAVFFLRPAKISPSPRMDYSIGFDAGPTETVQAFGFDENLNLATLGYLSLSEALSLVEQRRMASRKRFEDGEGAYAATSCGFSQSDEDFIEIEFPGGDFARVRAGSALTQSGDEETAMVDAVIAIDRLTRAYFAGPETFKAYWREQVMTKEQTLGD